MQMSFHRQSTCNCYVMNKFNVENNSPLKSFSLQNFCNEHFPMQMFNVEMFSMATIFKEADFHGNVVS
jgi:hypothetical protein